MLVVSLALVAVLVASGGNDSGTPNPGAGTEPGTPGASAAGTAEPTETSFRPAGLPLRFDLQERLDALPEKLRDETLRAYAVGNLTIDQVAQIVTDYENRNPSVRVGTVLATADGTLRIEVFTTGEQVDIATNEQTMVLRSAEQIALEDLAQHELVMIVSTREGLVAVTIEAFGVTAP